MGVWLNVRQCLMKPWAVLFCVAHGVYEFREETNDVTLWVSVCNEWSSTVHWPVDWWEGSWTVSDAWRMAWICVWSWHSVNGEREAESPLGSQGEKTTALYHQVQPTLYYFQQPMLHWLINSQCFRVWKNFVALSAIFIYIIQLNN